MKKTVLIIMFLLGMLSGYVVFASSGIENNSIVETVKITPTAVPTPTIVVNPPKRLIIQKLGIDAEIEYVGLDYEGKMDVPKNPDSAGWFELGYLPGKRGNAVIAGHLDKETGEPAIFYNLNMLEKEDGISIIDDKGKELVFRVVDKRSYPYNEFPSEEIFGPSDKFMLNLITCQGNWDASSRNYSNRLTVLAELLSPPRN
ncbi:class F sortase [Candidatus Roizmanbacteria bacterium]|nr:class F sortase [Candidatus Roizmanbacteria bacterium]